MTVVLLECQHCGKQSEHGSISGLFGVCCDDCRRELERQARVRKHHELAAEISDTLDDVFKT